MLSPAAVPETAPEPPALGPGEILLPGYVVVDLMARGGRVDTYDAYSEERDCRVVVKQVRPDRLDEQRVRAALLREGRLLRAATHPHLVRAYDVVEGDHPAVVLETLPGATLDALLDDGPLASNDVALLGLQLVSALAYLHRSGWLHLDLKPENVVVHGGRAVLIDLGLAAPPGRTGRGWGTPGYLSPEQARGADVDASTDVWGLGVTLAECATARLTFDPDDRWDAPQRPPAAPDLTDVDAPLRALLERCLAPGAADRPDLATVRADLVALAEGSAQFEEATAMTMTTR